MHQDRPARAPSGAGGSSAVEARRDASPPGTYEFKVRLNGAWDENYGAGGVAGGPNIPLVLTQHARS